MRLDQIDLQQAELNDLLDAYERARAVEGDVDPPDRLATTSDPASRPGRFIALRIQGAPGGLIRYKSAHSGPAWRSRRHSPQV
jgi:hypothetical protein